MTCVRFVKTTEPSTPYGRIDRNANIKCTDTIHGVDTMYSGWCECRASSGEKVIHGVVSSKRSFTPGPFTCEQQCMSPTWVPAISNLKMAYMKNNKRPKDSERINLEDQALCDQKDFYDIEHLPVDEVGSQCVSLQSDIAWSNYGNKKGPPASRLCMKR